jgi:aminoglycoside phosphotransferase (APT) family kinase protein
VYDPPVPRSAGGFASTESQLDRTPDEQRARLVEWFAAQLPGAADGVHIEGLDRVAFGHSAETMILTLRWLERAREQHAQFVLRLRPPPPGLLEPYDLGRQFAILRALEPTPVRSPRVLWHEASGDVLGREFYVMERLAGTVYERTVPPELATAPDRLGRMSRGIVEQIAAIHRVDPGRSGLALLGDGTGFLDRELARWSGEMHRVQRGPLPALERLLAELIARKPDRAQTVTLVHGDPKPGNFAFVGDEVSAVFDWELTSLGDPLADIGWAEVNWTTPGSFTNRPGAVSTDELVELYEELTGITVVHREWYRAFQGFKMVVIMLVAAMLFDRGVTDDVRFAHMGLAVEPYTRQALAAFAIDEELESGPVTARDQRLLDVQERAARQESG